MKPSSSNTGFFQQQPTLKNQWHDDISIQRISKLFLPSPLLTKISPEISQLADEVLTQQIFDWVTDAERNQPYLRGNGRDPFSKPKTELILTEGWRKLSAFGISKGFVAINYDTTEYGRHTRIIQFLRCHLWTGSCANTLCPAAMQDGAARLLQRHLTSKNLSPIQLSVFQNAYNHLISRDPSYAWTSGQWMTERTGGSDVSETETIAIYSPFPYSTRQPLASQEESIPLGPYSISGFKFFSSATDSQMTILLAKTPTHQNSVTAFFAPTRRYDPSVIMPTGNQVGSEELNGISIQRLKHKFGTQSLPTAELELKDMRGWMIGQEGKGIQEISTILTITRVYSSVTSLGYLGRALGIAKGYAMVREVGRDRVKLCENSLHMRTLSRVVGEYHGLMLLVFFTVGLLGLSERGEEDIKTENEFVPTPPKEMVPYLLRVLSSLHKSYVCEKTVSLVYQCMASLGGVGYMQNVESEYMNVSRLFRDACVGAIWEGTTDVLASDTVRALKHPSQGGKCVDSVEWFVYNGLRKITEGVFKEKVKSEWEGLKGKIEGKSLTELLPEARDLTFRFAEIFIAVLFLLDVAAHPGEEIKAMCDKFLREKGFVVGGHEEGGGLKLDQAIVYGPNQQVGSKVDSKL
ncbi:hypothetical protein QBC38DRAFT_508046 [Podospora fimiseda]|uniref:Acyl-CoA dehydrogenase/oxidase C-terminal domain-containing protein n=1 Tax=Podospora fimiseda TaxID=252190 RepID=A0AAN7GYF0_9PEZI|nr:hypothetical protein QBC38DRAFT_508046 [Podospora fimiseda]